MTTCSGIEMSNCMSFDLSDGTQGYTKLKDVPYCVEEKSVLPLILPLTNREEELNYLPTK